MTLYEASGKLESHRYWTNLVVGSNASDVDEVGHPDMGREFNLAAYTLRMRALLQALERLECVLSHSSVFEAGFGVGFYLSFWKAAGCSRVVGAEISPTAVANVRASYPSCDLRLLDIAKLPNESDWPILQNSFGLVTLIDILYHVMDDKEARLALQNVARLVRCGGGLILTEKFPDTSAPVSESRLVRRRPLDWYGEILGAEGLQ